ncbi:putative membrane protein [Senna tora]|uniref:Putative membrane protein n=1 Tax=Senna tora TaxID=362788 RepID=A0A834TQB3_9FABA|nr:putative membrane protein [Senna tora]
MNNLSNSAFTDHTHHFCSFKPIPSLALYILIPLFFLGFAVSVFFLIVVNNAAFFVFFVLLSFLVLAFIAWNTHNWRKKCAIFLFLASFPDSDIRRAKESQLVKITGLATCGSASLESSYEKATRCVYASTLLYECRGFGMRPVNINKSCFRWNLSYCERFSTDFYITDPKTGTRVVVKAGSGSKVIPLIAESEIIHTTGQCRTLSPHLKKWLEDRNLSVDARFRRLEEGYVQEGSLVTVIGMLRRNNDIVMIIEPPGVISTGCMWQKLLLPVDIDGLIIGISQMAVPRASLETQPIEQ